MGKYDVDLEWTETRVYTCCCIFNVEADDPEHAKKVAKAIKDGYDENDYKIDIRDWTSAEQQTYSEELEEVTYESILYTRIKEHSEEIKENE